MGIADSAAFAGFETPVPPPEGSTPAGAGDFIWGARARFFVGYTSNVEYFNDYLLPQPTPIGGLLGGMTFDLTAENGLQSGLTVGGGVRADLIGYSNGHDYDHYTLRPYVFVKHRSTLADGTDVTLRGTYAFEFTRAVNWRGLDASSHQANVVASFDVPGPWAWFVTGTITSEDYSIFMSDPMSNRDGSFKEIAVGGSYDFINPILRKITGKIGYQRNDASGANWTYSGFSVGGQADFNINGPWHGWVGASYASRTYAGDFTSQGFSPGRQNQQATTLEGRVVWNASPTHTADFGVKHEIVTSNSSQFTGNKTTFTAGVTVKLH